MKEFDEILRSNIVCQYVSVVAVIVLCIKKDFY